MSYGTELIQKMYEKQQVTREEAIELTGYWKALMDYGIWKDGIQVIGCMNTPIRDVFLTHCEEEGFVG